MADFLAGPAGGARQTLERGEGHQIRLLDGKPAGVRVTCRCLTGRPVQWAPTSQFGAEDHWAIFNRLPHDEKAGPFVPVDATTGLPLGPGDLRAAEWNS